MHVFRRVAVCLLLSVAAFSQETGRIFLVRHAEKQSNEQDTPLSSEGLARAKCLAQTLKDAHIGAAFVTQYQRTKQTAAPTVSEFHARETAIEAKATGQIVQAAREAAKTSNVLIVGHSNTVPDLLASFGAPAVTIPGNAYDQLFILDVAQPKQLLTLRYCPALPTDATAHPAGSMAKP
jgi:broad specificity phosphatase PhoE